jgi:hypothetical protein
MINLIIQLLGYLAFIFLAISLLVNNDIKFRWINGLGSLSFIFYGIMINAYPIILTNTVLLCINVYLLIKIYKRQEKFDLVEFKMDDALIPQFLAFYQNDMKTYFPEFDAEQVDDDIKFVVLRDIVIANIFVATLDTNGNAFVKVNYTIPKYRDYKVGSFLFEEGRHFLIGKGIRRIIYQTVHNSNHEKFLKVIGFKNELFNNLNCLVKTI